MTRILVILLVEFISFDRFYATSPICHHVDNKIVCYFQPTVASTNMTWDDAWKVCNEYNSTLPVIENQQIEEKLKSYVQSKTSLTDEMWLAGRENRTSVWQWLNGKPFRRQNIPNAKDSYNTNAVTTERLNYLPRYSRDSFYYICQCTDCILCQNKETIRFGNGCIVVNNNESLNVVEARNRCLDKGGDLATFEDDEELSVLKKSRHLLYESRSYWIGLRLSWWIWNETDFNKEIKYSNWLTYENALNRNCLYVYLHNYKWSQDSCTATKPFICQTVKTYVTHELDTVTDTYTASLTTGVITGFIFVIALVITVSLVRVVQIRNSSARQTSDKNLPTESSYQTLQHRLHEQDALENNQNYAELQITHPQNDPTEPRYLDDQLQYEIIGDIQTPPVYLEITSDHRFMENL